MVLTAYASKSPGNLREMEYGENDACACVIHKPFFALTIYPVTDKWTIFELL